MPDVYIGFGSNIGNRLHTIVVALQRLKQHPQFLLKAVSALYETEPVGYKDQADFLNGVVCFDTDLPAVYVLQQCQNIEKVLGRTREIRWGPRVIDLDILLYGSETIETEQLTVPHPQLAKRRFVLAPLHDIAKDVKVPGTAKSVEQLYNECDDNSQIQCVLHSERLAKKLDED